MKSFLFYLFALVLLPGFSFAASSEQEKTIDLIQQGKIEAAIVDKEEINEQEVIDMNTRTKIDAVEADTQVIDHKNLKIFGALLQAACQMQPSANCLRASNQVNYEIRVSDSRGGARDGMNKSLLFRNVESGSTSSSDSHGTR